MPRVCRICSHSDREAIDLCLVSGGSYRDIAGRFGMSRTSVQRHKAAHLSPAIVQVAQEHEAERVVSLLDRVESLVNAAESILRTAQDTGKAALALSAIREVRESLKLLGAASGELRDRPTVQIGVNLQASPDWIATRSALLLALRRHPEALADVSTALAQLERTPALGPGTLS